MERKKHRNIGLEIVVIMASVLGLMLLLYFVMIVSFQSGATSSNVTMRMASQIARRIFDNPTQDQIETTSLMIRYGAHLGLFFVVGLVTTFVSLPLSYVTTSVRPSSFQESQIFLPSAHRTRSSGFFVLARERAAYSCGSF